MLLADSALLGLGSARLSTRSDTPPGLVSLFPTTVSESY